MRGDQGEKALPWLKGHLGEIKANLAHGSYGTPSRGRKNTTFWLKTSIKRASKVFVVKKALFSDVCMEFFQ